jgi:anti-sigma B factor antagonist
MDEIGHPRWEAFMKLTTHETNDITILAAIGEITLGVGDEMIRKAVSDLIAQGKRQFVLNLSKVNFIDSSGVGEIVRAFTTLQKLGGAMKLCGLQDRVHDLFSITKLIMIFETFDTEEAAIKSFK